MAYVRMNAAEARAKARVDVARLDAVTDADVRRPAVEAGHAPAAAPPASARVVESPASLRARLGITQPEMAGRLRVPLRTWRNWEQGRVTLEPTVRALLALVADDPERAFRVLDGGAHKPSPQPTAAEARAEVDADL